MTEEIWKDIEGYEGLYQVSNLGRVKRLAGSPWCKKERILKNIKRGNRYYYVDLCKNKKSHKSVPIHRIVLEAFCGVRRVGYDPDHINKNKLDNRLMNLRWCSIYENRAHKGEENVMAKLKNGEVWLIKKFLYYNIKRTIISKMFRVNWVTINDIKKGTSWGHIIYEGNQTLS